ncbi:hypothetical protein D3C78_1842170 [compost metagenome]
MFQARIDFWCCARKQQYHARQEHQHRQHWSSQPGCDTDGLAGKYQALCFTGQQYDASQQQRQHDVDQSIKEQGRSQRGRTQLIGEGGE